MGGCLEYPLMQPSLLAAPDAYLDPLSAILKDRELHPDRCRYSGRDSILLARPGPQSELWALFSKSDRDA
jgi:hypothetical protein